MGKTYMGIDPGNKGYIAIQRDGEFEHHALCEHDVHELADLFYDIRSRYPDIVCAMEDVRAIQGSSAGATFTFGMNKGMLLALLCAVRIPYELVPPKTWQHAVWTTSDIVRSPGKSTKSKTDTKATSISVAKRLFPCVDFRRTPNCRTIDDNKVDATLISEYARRKNL